MAKTLLELVKGTIERGIACPYDDEPVAPHDLGRIAAVSVIADLTDRRGIKNGFNDIDDDVRKSIVDDLTNIINAVHSPEFKFEDFTGFRDQLIESEKRFEALTEEELKELAEYVERRDREFYASLNRVNQIF
jgi:hypothetical protein